MKAIIFDGKAFARTRTQYLKLQVADLKAKGVTPKLVTLLIGDDPASELYVSLKKKAGEAIGVEVEVFNIGMRKREEYIIRMIKSFNEDEKIHGIMVQLPLPRRLGKERDQILLTISKDKDVDGLRKVARPDEKGIFLPATVKAVIQTIEVAKRKLKLKDNKKIKTLVIGASGMVGAVLLRALEDLFFDVQGTDKTSRDIKPVSTKADLIISTTGKPGVVTSDKVKEGAMVIDVGAPKGDVLFKEVVKRAAFVTPVPGGIGPVTIASLLENLVQAAYNQG